MADALESLLAAIRACRFCALTPNGEPLPHAPRPVLQASSSARFAIFSQAPGQRVHDSGRPFTDASSDRLRDWLGIGEDVFYDAARVAIVPMGFCFPGYDTKGGDRPPRKECAPLWRARLIAGLPKIRTAILVGAYAHAWRLGGRASSLTATVARWRVSPRIFSRRRIPSWRNNGRLRKNPSVERESPLELRRAVRESLD